ncbi:hypothetical protein LIS66_13795 [Pseudomonas sp. HN2]|uniref:hypothetical protein n=1 Tax=Pseudomonas sp. HN2 TaxID=2884805 RepID=UPI001D147429|nr:hypothetical protein [Pseudomonas sp. HN2]UEB93480.1 hypothetical protein LIS66_13795 [Pseudomonas sp. HN2]
MTAYNEFLEEIMVREHPSRSEISKILGEPVGFDISETASKLRRNLLLVSLVVIVLIVGEIQPGADISLFGVKLTGVTPLKLMIGLTVLLFYNFVHYLWYCYELYSEWTIRITGTRLAFVTGGRYGAVGADYPDNPKQSTLYTWWLQESRSMVAYEKLVSKVDESVSAIERHIDGLQRADMTVAGSISISIQSLAKNILQVRQALEATESVITNNRVPESLGRFDNRFRLLLKSQNLRVLLIEVGIPVLLSFVAAAYLARFFIQS